MSEEWGQVNNVVIKLIQVNDLLGAMILKLKALTPVFPLVNQKMEYLLESLLLLQINYQNLLELQFLSAFTHLQEIHKQYMTAKV